MADGSPGLPFAAINMVASLDGRVAVEGRASGLGGAADRALMRHLRAAADAVMTGAGTLRAEKVNLSVPEDLARERLARGQRARPLAVIPTASGRLGPSQLPVGTPPEDLLILTSEQALAEGRLDRLPEGARVQTVRGGTSALDPTGILELLREQHAVSSLLVEGGPRLNHSLVAAGLARELFLTVAPTIVGGTAAETLLRGPSPLAPDSSKARLLSVHFSKDEELFLRYRLAEPASRRQKTDEHLLP